MDEKPIADMKTIFCMCSLLWLLFSSNAMAQEEKSSIRVMITDENGRLIEKEYSSAEALENDPELKAMGVEVEAENGHIRMKSSGKGNQSVVIQQNSGKGNRMYIQQGPYFEPGTDSVRRPPHPWVGIHEADSFRQAEHLRMMEVRDSLLSHRHERREEHRREMEERRAEMRRHMKERRENYRRDSRRDRQLVIIEDLSKREAEQLGIKNRKLELEDLKISPNPAEKSLRLRFSNSKKASVKIVLSDENNRLLMDETFSLEGKSFDRAFELDDFGEGVYFLQIIQGGKTLSRKIRIEE